MFEVVHKQSGECHSGLLTSEKDANFLALYLDSKHGGERKYEARPAKQKMDGLSYSEMIEAIHRGAAAARLHWTQQGKYIWWEQDRECTLPDGTKALLKGHIRFKTSEGTVEIGTQASTGGMHPDNRDWYLVDPKEEVHSTAIEWTADVIYRINNEELRTSQRSTKAGSERGAEARIKADFARHLESAELVNLDLDVLEIIKINIQPADK